MGIEIRRAGERIEIETDELTLRVDPGSLRFDLESRRAGVALRGARPRALLEEGALEATDASGDARTDEATALGDATRVELRARAARGAELHLAIDAAAGWPGVVLGLDLENGSSEPLRVRALEPLRCARDEGGAVELPGRPGLLRVFRLGWQSWTPAGWARLGEREPRPRLPLVRHVHFGPHTPLPRRGLHASDAATSIAAPGGAGLTLGFLSHHRFLSHATLEGGRAGVEALTAAVATESLPLAPGARLRGERLWVGLDAAGADGVARWAERAGAEMGAPVPGPVGAGWCSWYHFFTRVTAEDVRRNVESLGEFAGQIDTVQIDDGWQATVGDWLDFDPDFPDGVAPLAEAIRAAGFRPGLWLAPFLVSRASRVAREHPEWLLRRPSGRARTALINPGWKGRVCHALDLTHPGALDWLERVFASVRDWGFEFLKLDFLYAGCLGGKRHEPDLPTGALYRRALERIRAAAGPEAVLLGCGAPLGPSIGLFEVMRIGPDVAPHWRGGLADRLYGVAAAPSAENSLRNVLARAALHQRLWVNDPDCVLVRDRDTDLTETEVRTLAAVIAASGGLAVVSDDLAAASEERLALLRRMLPPHGRAPTVAVPRGEIPERLEVRFPDGAVLLLHANLSEATRRFEVDPRACGLEGPVRVYDALEGIELETAGGPFRTAEIPPRGSSLLRLIPAARRPALAGSSLHLAGGSVETVGIRESTEGGAELELRLPGRRAGRLLVVPASGPAVAVGVGFEDTLALRVRSREGP